MKELEDRFLTVASPGILANQTRRPTGDLLPCPRLEKAVGSLEVEPGQVQGPSQD